MPYKVKIKKEKEERPKIPQAMAIERAMKTLFSPMGGLARKRLAENIMPWNYGDYTTGKKSLQRGVEAIILGKKEPERIEKEQYLQKGYGQVATDEDKVRLDLLSMYGGLKPKYGTLKQSAFRPVIETEKGISYLDSDVIRKNVASKLPPIKSVKDFELYVSSIADSDIVRDEQGNIVRGETGGIKTKITGLGTANIAYGEDKKGPYISYYDKWDIDPTTGQYAEKEGVLKETLKTIGKEMLSAGSNPPQVYGRIYLDRKTGKPIL